MKVREFQNAALMNFVAEQVEGFLTSQDLFYVRNHGPVPEVLDPEIPDWELSIEGYVFFPVEILVY